MSHPDIQYFYFLTSLPLIWNHPLEKNPQFICQVKKKTAWKLIVYNIYFYIFKWIMNIICMELLQKWRDPVYRASMFKSMCFTLKDALDQSFTYLQWYKLSLKFTLTVIKSWKHALFCYLDLIMTLLIKAFFEVHPWIVSSNTVTKIFQPRLRL